MIAPNKELMFAMADLYPNMGGLDTSTLAVPETDDLEALNNDTKASEEANVHTEARSKNIFIALGVLLALVVFFGGK